MPSDVNLGVRRACSRSAGVSFSSAFKSRVIMQSLIRFVTFPYHYRPQTKCRSFADGSGGPGCALRTSPSGFELTPTFGAVPLADAASPLTCPPAAANPSTFAALTTPEGLRHYRSSVFRCRKIIPSHSFAALAALIVRRVSGYGDQPSLACASRRATPKGVERVPGSGTLPSAYFPVFGGATLAPGRSDGASRICRGSLSPANISVSRR